ncbi:Type II toxin-antitoxin system HicA family toxin [Candidatus Magnetomoraceae bacterium gMMP-15]
MKAKHRKTFKAIFAKPTKANIKFNNIEALIKALGGEVREGGGSRIALEIFGSRKYTHRPHPGKEAKRYQVEEIRDWLTKLEIEA